METFFSLSILLFATLAGFTFGFFGFVVVFVSGAIIQIYQKKKKDEIREKLLELKILKSLKGEK